MVLLVLVVVLLLLIVVLAALDFLLPFYFMLISFSRLLTILAPKVAPTPNQKPSSPVSINNPNYSAVPSSPPIAEAWLCPTGPWTSPSGLWSAPPVALVPLVLSPFLLCSDK